MQPLDLVFIKFLVLYGIYLLVVGYIKYFRINRNTSDNILDTYIQIELEKRLRKK